MDKVRALQLGTEDWKECYELPEEADWTYVTTLEEEPKKPYDIVFLDRNPSSEELAILWQCTKAYCLYITERLVIDQELDYFLQCKVYKKLPDDKTQHFLSEELRYYFHTSYGEKFRNYNMEVAYGFKGRSFWGGNCGIELHGDFGEEFSQIVYWKNNIPLKQHQIIELWLEYYKDPTIELKLVVTQYQTGSLSTIVNRWEFPEEKFNHVVNIEAEDVDGPLAISLHARGMGRLKIVALHDRYSRNGHGHFIPGGMRRVSSEREEVFFYFDPGDMKPPLNVYFSGYKTREGFEGYNLMRKKGCPFLLVSEARLEGGAFYMGSNEYENMIREQINSYIDKLGFTSDDVIMSGLSMGTFGSLYYGCDVRPHALILGKPLASIGDVALNEKLNRPGGFPTSLDVIMNVFGSSTTENALKLNDKFWNKFSTVNWEHTKFVMAYMIEDDYDNNAYRDVITNLSSEGVQVYGKGVHGRHNDDTNSIVGWFSSQFDKILKEDYGR